jgi:hypothetical protein
MYYINEFIFYENCYQYSHKISANSHTLVGYNTSKGFSGTNDRKLTMPFKIKSEYTNNEKGTNGKLLNILNRKINQKYFTLLSENTLSYLNEFIEYINDKKNVNILLDSGAIIIGMNNYEVAKHLLDNLNNIKGVVYYSTELNKFVVLFRKNNQIIELKDCEISLEKLFFYIDDIHTRGTDIKLPYNCEGLITIGLGK